METKETVKNAVQKSPEWLQDLIFSDALEETVVSICAPYNYPEEKTDDLTRTVALLLIGVNSEEDFLQSIKRVAINEGEANQLKKDITEYILDPIKKDLLEEVPAQVPVVKTVAPQQTSPPPRRSAPETMEYTGIVNYKPGLSLKDTLLKKESAVVPEPLQKEKSTFERRLAGFNDNDIEIKVTPPKESSLDPYREGV